MRKPKNKLGSKRESGPSETNNDNSEHQPMSGDDMNVVSFTNKDRVELQSEEVVERAYACLECHPHFRGRTIHLHICCSKSALTLEGRLPSYYLKQLLQAAIREVSEDRIIHNDVEVFNPSDPLTQFNKEREKFNVKNENQEEKE